MNNVEQSSGKYHAYQEIRTAGLTMFKHDDAPKMLHMLLELHSLHFKDQRKEVKYFELDNIPHTFNPWDEVAEKPVTYLIETSLQ